MGRPRKKARDLTTEEAMAKLFPKKAVTRAKEEARIADEKATKKESKG
jgi:hypothetical protein